MAIIYSYPEKTTPAGGDFLVITDSEQPAPKKNRTKSLTIDNLASYIVSSANSITGGGTLNTMAMFTPDGQKIGNSFMTYNPQSQFFVISKRLQVDGDLSVFGRGAFSGQYLRISCPLQDGNGLSGTAGQVLSSTGTGVEWTDNTATGSVTGTGTTNTLPKWLDGPNGVLSDSFIKQEIVAATNVVKIDGDNGFTDILDCDQVSAPTLLTTNITAEGTGNVILKGGVIIGDQSTDILQITSQVSDSTGTGSTAAGQVLVSNASSQLEWTDMADISGAVTGTGTTNTLPVWTDGANGVLGDSMITQNSNGSTAIVAGRLAVNADLSVTGYAGFNGQVQDGSSSPGTTGQVLTSTGTGVAWDDATDVVSGSVAKLIPHFQLATPGGSDTYTQSNNIVDFDWSGGSGTYEYILPSAAAIPYRKIRFVNNSTITASDKIHITAPGTETIDGGAFYVINKPYNGCAVWSDGVQWIVIQAKA